MFLKVIINSISFDQMEPGKSSANLSLYLNLGYNYSFRNLQSGRNCFSKFTN